jgi:stage II sporulation protein GA (sporulation sigma-E factor processing peptidase)
MVVYYDELLLINFILNSIILSLTAWSTNSLASKMRIISGALFGSVYALGELLPALALLYTPFSKLLFTVLVIVGVFGCQPLRRFGILVVAFFVNSFILGGAVIGWFYFSQSAPVQVQSPHFVITGYQLAGGGIVGIGFIMIWAKSFIKTFSRKNVCYPLKICYEGQVIELNGLLDTGNRLYSPLGHRPVVLVDQQALVGLLSNQVIQYLITNRDCLVETIHNIPDVNLMSRLEIIPYQGVGGNNVLVGFRPDWVEVRSVCNQAVIALAPVKLSADNCYQAVLHPDVVPGDNHETEANVCA